MELEMVYLPKSEELISPDYAEDFLVPREYGEMMAHKKYWIGLPWTGPRLPDAGNWRTFERGLRKEIGTNLRKRVVPDYIMSANNLEDYNTSKNKRWAKFSGWFSFGDTACEVDVYCRPKAVMDKKAAFLARIRGQMALPEIFVRNTELMDHNLEPAEAKARSLLREIIGDEAFFLYLRRGFLVVEGRSGMLHHIRGGHDMIEVRHPDRPHEVTEKLCVVFKGGRLLPHTDSVIMRLLMVRHDEFGLRAVANVYPCLPSQRSA